MQRTKALSVAALGLALLSRGAGSTSCAAEPPEHLAESFKTEGEELGSLESALRIRSVSGMLQLTRGVNCGELVDLYHGGVKVETTGVELESGPGPGDTVKRWDFVIRVIDLDVVRLGDGKPAHTRIITTLRVPGTAGGRTLDVSKKVFLTGDSSGSSFYSVKEFGPEASTENEAPLFFIPLQTRPNEDGSLSVAGARTVEKAVLRNPRSDLLVVRFLAKPPQGEAGDAAGQDWAPADKPAPSAPEPRPAPVDPTTPE